MSTHRGTSLLAGAVQLILLVGCVAPPWFFGGNVPELESVIALCVALGLILALLTGLWEKPRNYPVCVTLLLAVGILFGCLQLCPLPTGLLTRIAPASVTLQQELTDPLDDSARAVTFYPGSTRRTVETLCIAAAVFLLASIVFRDRTRLRWLLLMVALNGAAIAVFGLGQQLSWNGKIYGHFPLPHDGGNPFGPYINKNNAGGYLNLCFAAAIGLVVWNTMRVTGQRNGNLRSQQSLAWWERVLMLFVDLTPSKLAAILTTLFLAIGICSCLSRGAVLAFAVATVVVAAALVRRQPRLVAGVGSLGLIGIVLLGWLGRVNPIQERLVSIASPDSAISRLDHWRDAVTLVPKFWSTGTGLGTYRFIYLTEQRSGQREWFYHAENQYLETLVELGVPGIVLLAGVIVAVLIGVWRLLSRGEPDSLSLGVAGLFCLVSQIVAGFFDFGLYLPANMFLMATLCGALVGQASDQTKDGQSSSTSSRGQFIRIATLMLSGAVFFLGCLGAAHELRINRPKKEIRSLLAEHQQSDVMLDSERLGEWRRHVYEGLGYRSDDPELHLQLAEYRIHRFRVAAAEQILERDPTVADAATAWPLTSLPNLHLLVRNLQAGEFTSDLEAIRDTAPFQDHLLPAWEDLLKAREGCPLLRVVHLRLGQLDAIVEGDGQESKHLLRVTRVHPQHEDAPFGAGIIALSSADLETSFLCWRESLRHPSRHEKGILSMVVGQNLITEKNANLLLPDEPELLLRVARDWLVDEEQAAVRRRLLRRAQDAVAVSPLPVAEQHFLFARIHAALKEYKQAQSNFQAAIALQPDRQDWLDAYAKFQESVRQP